VLAVSLAIASAALWGSADFLGGMASRRVTVLVVTWLSQLAGLVTLGIVIVLAGAEISGAGAAWGAGAGVVGALALAVLYRALALGVMSLVAPLSATGAVVPVAVALIEGARPGVAALLGMVLALGGIVLIARKEDAAQSLTPQVIGLAAGAALGIGMVLALLQQGTNAAGSDALGVVFAARVASVAATSVALLATRTVPRAAAADLRPVAAVGVADTGANTLFVVASEAGSDALVAVLGSLYPVTTVLLARAVLAERLTARQALGVALALGGAALVSTG